MANGYYDDGSEDRNEQKMRQKDSREAQLAVSVNDPWSFAYWNMRLGRINEYDKILFARNLGSMLTAGLSLERALTVLERQTANPRFKYVIGSVADSVRKGDSFNIASRQYPEVFSELFTAMVRSGEESGDLPGSLTLVAEQMDKLRELKRRIKSAMIYPSIIIVAILGIGTFMMISVVPTLSATFKELHADLPVSTNFIIGLSDFLVKNSLLAIVGLVCIVVATVVLMRTSWGRRFVDFVLVGMPIISPLVHEVNSARTARTLSALLAAGVDVLKSIEITQAVVQNSYYREVLQDAESSVRAGNPLSMTFEQNEKLYPPFVGEMMSVGEETGATPEMLKRLAVYYEEEVDRKTKELSTIIEPFLMLAIGAAVGFFAVSMIAPIYSITQHI